MIFVVSFAERAKGLLAPVLEAWPITGHVEKLGGLQQWDAMEADPAFWIHAPQPKGTVTAR